MRKENAEAFVRVSRLAFRKEVINELCSSHPSIWVQEGKECSDEGDQEHFGFGVLAQPFAITDVFAPAIVEFGKVSTVQALFNELG